ncbi:MAG: helix-turn-helix domain-containing protein, partial [Bacilli bacterium]|nr:helix-turn-helix domain-containing protein [Bacilli bacterium]
MFYMSMLPSKGGQHMKHKHMTKEMRERIEKGIREGVSLKEIAYAISKDPTTISKEVYKHRNKV